jgi:hypothetical protein
LHTLIVAKIVGNRKNNALQTGGLIGNRNSFDLVKVLAGHRKNYWALLASHNSAP